MKCFFTILINFGLLNLMGQIPISPSPMKIFEERNSEDGFPLGEFLHNMYVDSTGNLIYNIQYIEGFSVFPVNLDFEKDVLKGNLFDIVKKNNKLKVIHELSAESLTTIDKQYSRILHIEENTQNDGYRIIGIGSNMAVASENTWFFLEVDGYLNRINETWFEPPIDSVWSHTTTIKKASGNYIFLVRRGAQGSSLPYPMALVEISPNGTVVRKKILDNAWADSFFQVGGLLELDSMRYVLLANSIIDKDFNLVCNFQHQLFTSGSILSDGNDRFIFGGSGYFLAQNNEQFCYEAIYSGIDDCTLDTIYTSVLFPCTDISPLGYFNIARADSTTLYFATHRGGSHAGYPTTLYASSIDVTEGTLNWQYYFGGDYSYTPLYTLTMQDGSLLLIVFKISWNLPWSSDILFVQFDKNGQVVNSSVPPSEISSVLLYPNPMSDQLYLSFSPHLKSPHLCLYDSYGQLQLNQKLTETESQIDISKFPTGVYSYQFRSEGRMVQTGKLIKI